MGDCPASSSPEWKAAAPHWFAKNGNNCPEGRGSSRVISSSLCSPLTREVGRGWWLCGEEYGSRAGVSLADSYLSGRG